jgi:hypothetical protein
VSSRIQSCRPASLLRVKKLSPDAWLFIAVVVVSLAILFTVTMANCRSMEHMCRTPHISTDPQGPNWAEILMVAFTIALAVAAFRALGAVNEARNARNAVQMAELSRRWNEETNQEARKLVYRYADEGLRKYWGIRKYGHKEPPGPFRLKASVKKLRDDKDAEYWKLLTDPNFLENLAILVKGGGMDYQLVNMSLGYLVPYRWSLWQPTIVEWRDFEGEIYVHFEELAKQIAAEDSNSMELNEEGEVVWDGFKD